MTDVHHEMFVRAKLPLACLELGCFERDTAAEY